VSGASYHWIGDTFCCSHRFQTSVLDSKWVLYQ